MCEQAMMNQNFAARASLKSTLLDMIHALEVAVIEKVDEFSC
jgi:hypothetical protein